jgi:uncharacterized membrane protein
MMQDEINWAEWNTPDNWHGGWLEIYQSRRDSRIFVPKRLPSMGWTVNTGHPVGRILAVALPGIALLMILRASRGN